jgi:hypothetical protein
LGTCRAEFDKTVRPYVSAFPIGERGVGFDRQKVARYWGFVQAKKSPHSAGLVVDEDVLCMSFFTLRYKANLYPLAQRPSCAGESCQSHAGIILVERTVNSSSACVHALGQGLLCYLLGLHGFSDLPRDDTLEGSSRHFLCETLFCKKVVEIGADVLFHCLFLSSVALRCLAVSRSDAGVFWLFLMKP